MQKRERESGKREKHKQKIDAKDDRDDVGVGNHPEDAANEGEEPTEDVQNADHKVEHVHCFVRREKEEKKDSLTHEKKKEKEE